MRSVSDPCDFSRSGSARQDTQERPSCLTGSKRTRASEPASTQPRAPQLMELNNGLRVFFGAHDIALKNGGIGCWVYRSEGFRKFGQRELADGRATSSVPPKDRSILWTRLAHWRPRACWSRWADLRDLARPIPDCSAGRIFAVSDMRIPTTSSRPFPGVGRSMSALPRLRD